MLIHQWQPDVDVIWALMQVNIPVLVPGRPPMSVALLGLQRSDTRLLHVAAKLGPLISAAAQEAAMQQVGLARDPL
jgi:hypothetical protein